MDSLTVKTSQLMKGLRELKAAVLHGQKDIRYEEVENPVIGDEEILVKVKVTGFVVLIYQEFWTMPPAIIRSY